METARLGSLSAAAEALSVSQPAASKTIKELEVVLGCLLFDRSGRRLTLTQAGRVFQQHAGAGLLSLKRAQELVQGAAEQSARLSIGVLPTAATTLMAKAALAFQAEFPACRLRVSTGPNWLLMSQLREGSLDLVVGRMATVKVMAGLSFRQLYSERIGAIVRPGHPLCAASDPESALGDFPQIVPPPGAVISPLVQSYLNRLGIPAQDHRVETVSLAFGRNLVQSSDAIWFISLGVVANELEGGTLNALNISDDLLGGPVGVSMREDGVLSGEQRGMLRALEAVAKGVGDPQAA